MGLHTWGCKGLQRVTLGYKGYRGSQKVSRGLVTRDYRGLYLGTRGYMGLQGVTGGYNGLYRVKWGYKRLQGIT